MVTEKDIRQFIKDNRIEISDDRKFMEEIIRQINLLPVPAGYEKKSTKEKVLIIKKAGEAIKRRNKIMALESVIVNIIGCCVIFLATFLSEIFADSDLTEFLIQNKYLWCGISCAILTVIIGRSISGRLI